MGIRLNISLGNTKLGKVPNVSLPAIKTCPPNIPCIKECYCNSNVFYWQMAREKWEENYQLYQTDPHGYFLQLNNFLVKKKPPYFRWHVSGDVPDEEYKNKMIRLMLIHPQTKFLMFTKRYSWNFHEAAPLTFSKDELPNFKVKYSVWGTTVPVKIPRAWVIPQENIPKGEEVYMGRKVCKGKCDDCYFCWNFNSDVVLIKH